MPQVIYTREIEMFGVTVGDCVIAVEYDREESRRELLSDRDAKWTIASVSICGTDVEDGGFGFNHLSYFETMLSKVGNPFGMAKAFDEIQTLVNEAATAG